MKKILTLSILFSAVLGFKAQQDRHYSMFYASPVTINPAAAGFFEGNIQAFMGYKDQWKAVSNTPFKTISSSIDGKILENQSNDGFLGGGISFYNDKAGESNLITNVYNATLNYAIAANNSKLALGIQPGFIQRHIGNTSLTWDEQWNGNTFDSNLSNGEVYNSQKEGGFDLGAGLFYEGKFADRNIIYAGVALGHLLRPTFTLLTSEDNLYRKVTFHAGGEFKGQQSRFSVLPNLIYFQQGPNLELTFGSDFKYLLTKSSKYTGYYDESSISFGTYIRTKDAFYTTLFMNFSGFSFGVSYDLNLSGLSVATQGRGGMELLLRYRISLSGSSSSSF